MTAIDKSTPAASGKAHIGQLEEAILERAAILAKRTREQGARTRDQLLNEVTERLQLREDREVLFAKNLAERTYRRRVQSSDLRLQKQADILRWQLVQDVLADTRKRAAAFAQDDPDYLPFLHRLIAHAAEQLDSETLQVEVNERDRARLAGDWDNTVKELAAGKSMILVATPIRTEGGARISSADGRVRIDETLEGRVERLQGDLHTLIMERLFASVPDMEALFKG